MISRLLDQKVQQYIKDHQDNDVASLMLSRHQFSEVSLRAVIGQIQSRQKARHKIPLWLQTNNILFPPPLSLEQCSSELTANFKSGIMSGDHLLDLTGGVGVDTFFLAKNFNGVTMVELQSSLCDIARHNFQQLNCKNIVIENMSAEKFMEGNTRHFDWIYIDPSRRGPGNQRVFNLTDCQPDVTEIYHEVLKWTHNLMIKLSPMLDIKMILKQLNGVQKIWVLAIKNEVKEVLVHVKKQDFTNPALDAVNILDSNMADYLSFSYGEEEKIDVNYALPQKYIYEPNQAILKAGAFKTIARRYDLSKLHANSHLYTSSEMIRNFPGRKFSVISVEKLNKKVLTAKIVEGSANITVRNFPLSIDQIRQKTRLKEGGNKYLFATTNLNDQPVVIICDKVDHP